MGEKTQTYLDNTGQNHYNYFAKMVFVCAPRNFAGAKERNDLNMANMKKEYKMSAERKEELQKELTYLKTVREKEVADLIKEARGFGDLSENFEYKAAKREKNRNDSRIRYLERMIKTAKVIDASSNPDEIGLFDKVTIRLNPDYYTGKEFVIETTGNTPENYYIGSLELDGKPLQSVQLPFAEVVGGGTLRVNLAAEPNTQLNK
mgnify:CR=1 FL=1